MRISPTETSAQLLEAEANAAQIEARLGLADGQPFDPKRVPDVHEREGGARSRRSGVRAHRVAARSEGRLAERVRPARTQVDAARQQYQMAQNVAQQSYRSLEAARARVDARAQGRRPIRPSARRSPAWSPSGVVSVGDYVTRGARVATVVRVDPMRIELTVPEQSVSLDQGRPAGAGRGRRVSRRDLRRDGPLRLAVAARRSARADGRGARRQPRRPAEARPVRDRARSSSRSRPRRCSFRRPRSKRSPAPAASTSSRATRSRSGSSRSARRSASRSRSPAGWRRETIVAAEPKGRIADGTARARAASSFSYPLSDFSSAS